MPAPTLPARIARTLLWRGPRGTSALVLLALCGVVACRPPAPADRVVDPSAPFSRPVATLGPDDAVANGIDTAAPARAGAGTATPPTPVSADWMKQAIDATGRVALHLDFDSDRSRLRAEATPMIGEITTLLRNDPALRLSIDGHTDAGGSAARDRELSRQLAEAVRVALIANGIDADRLRARGHGADRPLAGTSRTRDANRRVELVRLD